MKQKRLERRTGVKRECLFRNKRSSSEEDYFNQGIGKNDHFGLSRLEIIVAHGIS